MVLAAALIGASLAAYHGVNAYRNFQRGQEYDRMKADYRRNTGRDIKYDKVRGYSNDAYNSYMNAWQYAGQSYTAGYGTANQLGKTYSDFMKG